MQIYLASNQETTQLIHIRVRNVNKWSRQTHRERERKREKERNTRKDFNVRVKFVLGFVFCFCLSQELERKWRDWNTIDEWKTEKFICLSRLFGPWKENGEYGTLLMNEEPRNLSLFLDYSDHGQNILSVCYVCVSVSHTHTQQQLCLCLF